ncbi:MAG: ribulose-phosphate 3-epimerase [Firmicutes bacterium]|nr:ribulose-phosphate 3-epimerase [Bacillota bacterium]
MKTKIAPSILSADFSKMGEQIEMISNADFIHCDVMDGRFVPNLTFGMKMIKDIKKTTNIPLDVHLMIEEPENYIEEFIKSGADYLTFHIEATKKIDHCLDLIHLHNIKGGLAISPDTPIYTVESHLNKCDIIVVMSVYPGFGGQKFIPASLEKITALKKMITDKNFNTLIEVDGGVTFDNAKNIMDAGADILVAGNTVFGNKKPKNAIKTLQN